MGTGICRQIPQHRKGNHGLQHPCWKIYHSKGEWISTAGELVDLAVQAGIVDKAGAWYSYKGEKIGQGKENVKELFNKNPKLKDEIYASVRKFYSIEKKETNTKK